MFTYIFDAHITDYMRTDPYQHTVHAKHPRLLHRRIRFVALQPYTVYLACDSPWLAPNIWESLGIIGGRRLLPPLATGPLCCAFTAPPPPVAAECRSCLSWKTRCLQLRTPRPSSTEVMGCNPRTVRACSPHRITECGKEVRTQFTVHSVKPESAAPSPR